MKSIRTKITTLAVVIVIISMSVATVIGTVSVKRIGDSSTEQILKLLCETGEKNLDAYFGSVEQSVTMVSDLVVSDLENTELDNLGPHVERVRAFFEKAAFKTQGVLTYYYRIDPSVSDTEKGFWYINLDGSGFSEHAVTEITEYDIENSAGMVWFSVPKATGRPIWLPPYVTQNLDKQVISYNIPVYKENLFVGVVGIEIDYTTMVTEVNNIRLYENGYAFLSDGDGNLVYHPQMDITTMPEESRPSVPDGILETTASVRYVYNGIEKQAVWLPLINGMRLNVAVPVSEINSGWRQMIVTILIVSAVLLMICILMTAQFTRYITKPLCDLTAAAEQVDAGNYDVMLNYNGNDEVGVLSRTVDRLIGHLRIHISDLNSLANTDALTAVSNKGAYDIKVREIQQQVNDPAVTPAFAIAIFDCDDLKLINDRYGHDKGDIYLKNTSALICHVFQHSPVYRIGGDEFAVILTDDDYQNRQYLADLFVQKCEGTCVKTNEWWEQVRVSMGMAVYNPDDDRTVDDVSRRADKLMYENKHDRKIGRA
ncbi:MAG: diguanylate cyclase [Clostridia bacterium]|nr:diguanylate cyclase [Clostridia bacterium]